VATEAPASPLKSTAQATDQKLAPAGALPDLSLPANAVDSDSRPKDSPIEQVRYPAPSASREFVPEPPRLSELPLSSQRPLPGESQPRPERVETQAKPAPEPVVLSAMRCYLNKRPAQALLWLDHFDKPTQELLLYLLPLVARLGEGNLEHADRREIDALLVQLETMRAMLRLRADLVIDKMGFCSWIQEFGVYQPLEENHPFLPGDVIELYAELRNFSTEQIGKRYRIQVSSRVEIRDYRGKLIWSHAFDDRDHPAVSRSLRSDFHNRYSFPIPADIPRGNYTLWLSVTDLPTGRTAKRSLDFRVVDSRSW
jgi:hypothetical protein